MPAVETHDLVDFAVLWLVQDGVFDDNGQPVIATAPVEVMCRWTETVIEQIGPTGTMRSRGANVVVGRSINPGSRMWHGRLDEWVGTYAGDTDVLGSEVMEVISFIDTKDVKGRVSRRELKLQGARQA